MHASLVELIINDRENVQSVVKGKGMIGDDNITNYCLLKHMFREYL